MGVTSAAGNNSHTNQARHSPLFFKSKMSGSYRPPSTGYGVPQAPILSGNNFNQQGPYLLYRGYDDDIYLLIKLGHAALIIFIIFAIVCILYILFSCCMVVFNDRKRTNKVFGKKKKKKKKKK